MEHIPEIKKLGDKHNGNYVSLSFYNGRECIRKPRAGDIEYAFSAFLQKLEEEGFLYLPGCVEILRDNGQEHYVAIVEHKEIEKLSDLHLYYKRCGVMLFLSYLFSSTDLHRENIIACGALPTIVDYETLFSGDDRREWISDYPVLLSDSVWNSYLLPRWKRFNNLDIDVSGLTGHLKEESFEQNPNIPYLNGEPMYAWDFEEDIIEGFCYSYDFFINNNQNAREWLGLFQKCSFRIILRKTEIYTKLINLLEDYPLEKRELGANLLLRRAYENDTDPNRLMKMEKVLEEEIRAVSQGEIPLFNINASSKDIVCRGVVLCKNYYLRSPIEHAKRKLSYLSPINRDGQVKIISQMLAAVRPLNKLNRYQCKIRGVENKYRIETTPRLSVTSKVPDECVTIFRKLEDKAIEGMPDHWLCLNREMNGPVKMTGVGAGLYHGVIGILCFYAALYLKTGEEDYLTKLLQYYEPVRKELEKAIPILNSDTASLNRGIGGILLGLYHISELTNIPCFKNDAESLSERIVIPGFLSRENTDVLSGYAGLAIALGKARDMDNAKRIAKALMPVLANEEPVLTGYAHGAAGYSLAIGVLSAILDESKYNDRILELLDWENKHFDRQVMNWKDLRDNNGMTPKYMNGWCGGTPGITMARKQLYSITKDDRIKVVCSNDIRSIEKWFGECSLEDYDSLCCGNAAKIMAASRLGISMQLNYERLIYAVKNDRLNFHHLIRTRDFNPGLMQGYAGIGYALAMYGDRRSGGMLV